MNQWVQTSGCGGVSVVGGPIAMEAVTITDVNTAAPLVCANGFPDGNFTMLVVNGMVFLPVGTSPPFSISGAQITWLSTIWGMNPGDTVAIAYSYGGAVL
jgi:hypothetical protein